MRAGRQTGCLHEVTAAALRRPPGIHHDALSVTGNCVQLPAEFARSLVAGVYRRCDDRRLTAVADADDPRSILLALDADEVGVQRVFRLAGRDKHEARGRVRAFAPCIHARKRNARSIICRDCLIDGDLDAGLEQLTLRADLLGRVRAPVARLALGRHVAHLGTAACQRERDDWPHVVVVVIEHHDRTLRPRTVHDVVGCEDLAAQHLDRRHVPAAEAVAAPARTGREQYVVGTKVAHLGGREAMAEIELDIAHAAQLAGTVVAYARPFSETGQAALAGDAPARATRKPRWPSTCAASRPAGPAPTTSTEPAPEGTRSGCQPLRHSSPIVGFCVQRNAAPRKLCA